MIIVEPKKEGIKYIDRKTVYIIIIHNNKIILLNNIKKEYFLVGGGVEKNESNINALKRECLEEIGYELCNLKKLFKLQSYEYNSKYGYLNYISDFYIGSLKDKIKEPVEKEEYVIELSVDEAINILTQNIQRYALKLYKEEIQKNGK